MAICAYTDAFAHSLFRIMKREDLIRDKRFATRDQRVMNFRTLDIVIGEWTALLPTQKIMDALHAADIPAAEVRDPTTAMRDPRVRCEARHRASRPSEIRVKIWSKLRSERRLGNRNLWHGYAHKVFRRALRVRSASTRARTAQSSGLWRYSRLRRRPHRPTSQAGRDLTRSTDGVATSRCRISHPAELKSTASGMFPEDAGASSSVAGASSK